MSGFIPQLVHLAHVRFQQLDNTPCDFKHLSPNYHRNNAEVKVNLALLIKWFGHHRFPLKGY